MAAGAARLLASRGVRGASFAEVLALTGAPRGSTYHHFPGGKDELVLAALDVAAAQGREAMEPTRGKPAPDVVRAFAEMWQDLLERSELRSGCAVLAVAVDNKSERVREHAGAIFATWTDHLAELLIVGGVESDAAHPFATLMIAATEGAVAMSRAQGEPAALAAVGQALASQAEALVRPRRRAGTRR